jgi:hypothetical protein
MIKGGIGVDFPWRSNWEMKVMKKSPSLFAWLYKENLNSR